MMALAFFLTAVPFIAAMGIVIAISVLMYTIAYEIYFA